MCLLVATDGSNYIASNKYIPEKTVLNRAMKPHGWHLYPVALVGVTECGLRPVVLLRLGYRDPTGDRPLPMRKERKSRDNTVTEIN